MSNNHGKPEYVDPQIVDNIYDTRFFREALFCLYKKFDGSQFLTKLYASFLKRLLKLVTKPIHNELVQNELYDRNKNKSVQDDTYSFNVDNVPLNFYLPYARFDSIQQAI